MRRRRGWSFVLLTLLAVLPLSLRAERLPGDVDDDAVATGSIPSRQPVESDLVVEGLASYGNYKIFAAGTNCKLYTAGFEYDRNVWGRFLGARIDWVAEVLPLVLLNKPDLVDQFGNTQSYARETVPGIGISPIGFRMLWRDHRGIKPYLMAKGGMVGFTQKVPAPEASYQNFSLQSGMGVNLYLNPKIDLRLGLFSDFHFSNAFMVASNPGLDVMNANIGISYHLGKRAVH